MCINKMCQQLFYRCLSHYNHLYLMLPPSSQEVVEAHLIACDKRLVDAV